MKQCRSCGVEKPLDEYFKRNDTGKHRNDCKQCQRDAKNAEQYKRLYGITLSDYDDMFIGQGGNCAICHLPQHDSRKNRLCVDHDHVSGMVRGLLCSNCNVGIGLLKDDERILLNAIQYLRAAQD